MSERRGRAARRRVGTGAFAVAVVIGSIAVLTSDPTTALASPFVLVAALAIVVGELFPVSLPRRVTAPLTTTAALGLAMTPFAPGEQFSASTVVAVVWVSLLVGGLVAKGLRRRLVEGALSARFLGLVVVTILCHAPVVAGELLLDWVFDPGTPRVAAALVMLAASTVGAVVERLVDTVVVWADQELPIRAVVLEELGPMSLISAATVTSGPLVALSYPVLGAVAVPAILAPVGFAIAAIRRYAAAAATHRQTMRALSRLPEVVGSSRTGHADRVADLSARVARALELPEATVRRTHRAALLHDVGQLALDVPLPHGETIAATERALEQIATAGGGVVALVGGPQGLAEVLDQVRVPFRRTRELGETIPVEARIIAVCNAFDDLTEGGRTAGRARSAVERIQLGLGYLYDPQVVDALERVVLQDGVRAPGVRAAGVTARSSWSGR